MAAVLFAGTVALVSQGGEIPLQPAMLPDAHAILTSSDCGRGQVILWQAEVLPRRRLSFEGPGRTQPVSIGGLEFSLGLTATWFNISVGQSQAALLKAGESIRPQVLPLQDGRRYVLAFRRLSSESLALKSGMTMSGRFSGDVISLFDDDLDGFYTRSDTYATSNCIVYAPLADHLLVGGKPYRMSDLPSIGTKLTLEPYDGPKAKLAMVSSDRVTQTHLALVSDDAKMSFAMQVGTRLAEVIPGAYSVKYGLAYSPRLRKIVAGIAGASDTKAVVLKEGETQQAQFGPPYRLELKVTRTGRQFKISSAFNLYGAGGEEYVGFTILRTTPPVVSMNGRRIGAMEFT